MKRGTGDLVTGLSKFSTGRFADILVFSVGARPVRRKRLQHAADFLCRMFCGSRLANSYRSLASHGTGMLRIDALTGSCAFERPVHRRSKLKLGKAPSIEAHQEGAAVWQEFQERVI